MKKPEFSYPKNIEYEYECVYRCGWSGILEDVIKNDWLCPGCNIVGVIATRGIRELNNEGATLEHYPSCPKCNVWFDNLYELYHNGLKGKDTEVTCDRCGHEYRIITNMVPTYIVCKTEEKSNEE